LYHIAAQLESVFRLIDTDSDGTIAQEQVPQVLLKIGFKASQGQLQLLQDKLKLTDGKVGVEEFVQLAVLLEGGEGEHTHLDVPSAHVPQDRSPFITVKTFSNTSRGAQAERVSFDVGRLEIDLESIAVSVLLRWMALLDTRAVRAAPSSEISMDPSRQEETSGMLMSIVERLRGTFESDDEALVPPRCSRQVSLDLKHVDLCFHDPSAGQAAFFISLHHCRAKSQTSMPSKDRHIYVVETDSDMKLEVAYSRHVNAQPQAHDVILRTTGLKLHTQDHTPLDVAKARSRDWELWVQDDIDIHVSLKHLVFAQALGKRFASAWSWPAADRDASDARSRPTASDHVTPSLGLKSKPLTQNMYTWRVQWPETMRLAVSDDLSADVDESDFLEGEEDEMEVSVGTSAVLVLRNMRLEQRMDADCCNIDLQMSMQVCSSPPVTTYVSMRSCCFASAPCMNMPLSLVGIRSRLRRRMCRRAMSPWWRRSLFALRCR